MTTQDAERAFAELLHSQRNRALWFLREGVSVSIEQPEAASLLESLARIADRTTWLKIRRLRLWRSLHCSKRSCAYSPLSPSIARIFSACGLSG